jgi:hypothetical protein
VRRVERAEAVEVQHQQRRLGTGAAPTVAPPAGAPPGGAHVSARCRSNACRLGRPVSTSVSVAVAGGVARRASAVASRRWTTTHPAAAGTACTRKTPARPGRPPLAVCGRRSRSARTQHARWPSPHTPGRTSSSAAPGPGSVPSTYAGCPGRMAAGAAARAASPSNARARALATRTRQSPSSTSTHAAAPRAPRPPAAVPRRPAGQCAPRARPWTPRPTRQPRSRRRHASLDCGSQAGIRAPGDRPRTARPTA